MRQRKGSCRNGWRWAKVPARRVLAGVLMLAVLLSGSSESGATEEKDVTLKDVLEAPTLDKLQKEEAASAEEEYPNVPEDELNRGTPRSTVLGFAAAANASDFERAAEYLDLSRVPPELGENPGPKLALWLHLVAQRELKGFDASKLSRSPLGDREDGFKAWYDRIGRIPSQNGDVDLLLARVSREDGAKIWKIAASTVADIPRLYEEYGYGILGDVLPSFFFGFRVLYIQLWQWIALAILAPLCALAGWLASRALEAIAGRLQNDVMRAFRNFLRGPLSLLIATLLFTWAERFLGLSRFGAAVLDSVEGFLFALVLGWTAMRVSDALFEVFRRRLLRRGQMTIVTMLLPTAGKIAKFLVVTAVVMVLLDNLGFSITTILAGLSVAGVAIALAAQKTIENFIGGITLYADQPVRPGDFCRFGDTLGTVEEVGLRSTRVRTLERTVVSVPNAEFVNLHLDNFTRRDKIWYHPTIGLRYETSPDQIRYILVEIRRLLYGHPRVDPDGARIRFKAFGAYSLDLEVFAYVLATDYAEYLEIAEDLNLRIMDIVAEAGSSFAFPSQTTYVEQGTPLESPRAKAAEERVREWKQKNELFLPRFPGDRISALRGTVQYPPAGSPDARAEA